MSRVINDTKCIICKDTVRILTSKATHSLSQFISLKILDTLLGRMARIISIPPPSTST